MGELCKSRVVHCSYVLPSSLKIDQWQPQAQNDDTATCRPTTTSTTPFTTSNESVDESTASISYNRRVILVS